jgi:hypothetical protein
MISPLIIWVSGRITVQPIILHPMGECCDGPPRLFPPLGILQPYPRQRLNLPCFKLQLCGKWHGRSSRGGICTGYHGIAAVIPAILLAAHSIRSPRAQAIVSFPRRGNHTTCPIPHSGRAAIAASPQSVTIGEDYGFRPRGLKPALPNNESEFVQVGMRCAH